MHPEQLTTMPPPNFTNRTLYHGDNLAFMQDMKAECVDLIATDPPFNTGTKRTAGAGEYDDTWRWLSEHDRWQDGIRDINEALSHAVETARRSHSESMAAFTCFLSVRLLEMHRLLKPTGSIYLQCDDNANAYIRICMDAIFGRTHRQNELIWRRFGSHNDAKRWGRIHDSIHFYTKSDEYTWTGAVREPYTDEYLATAYKHTDSRGRYTTAPLHARGLREGEEFEWKGIRDIWRFTKENLDELDRQGMIHWTANGGVPRRKVHLDLAKGVPARDLILDVKPAARKEKTGAPDQKPLELYERIIKASSNEGDWVMDPFCGSGTTLIAAERLGRKWVGVDRREAAEAHLLNRLLFMKGWVPDRQFIPQTDGVFDQDRLVEAREVATRMGFVSNRI